MAHLRKKIVVIICGIFFSLIILEIGIRAGGFIFSSLQEYRNKVSIRRNGSYKIMCLGESTTARQYPGPLEEILNKRNIGISFSVIDKGIVGTNTFIILSQLKQNLDIYKPDMVIVMAGYNDVGIKYYEDIPEATTWVFQHCSVYRFIRLIYMHIVKKLKEQDIRGLGRVNPKKSATLSDLRSCHEKAEESLKKDIMLHTQNDTHYLELGWAYKNQNKLLEAEESFKKAIELNPKNDNAYFELGWLYREQGKFSQAEEAFKKVIDLNPKNNNAYRAILLLYETIGKPELAKEYAQKVDRLSLWYYNPATVNNYHKLKEILDKRGIRLVCVQYPLRSIEPLKKIFEKDEGVIFVDNESVFREVLKKASYREYFRDMLGGDFGHCTEKGNRLLAQNIADVILKELFSR